MNEVTIKLFGPLRDIARRDDLHLELPHNTTGEEVFAIVRTRYPEFERWKSSLRLAVNLEYVSFDHQIKPGDELCFIPPVSGG